MDRITAIAKTSKVGALTDLRGLEKLPNLAKFLTHTWYGDPEAGDERIPGTVYLCVKDGSLAVTLKEPSQRLMLRVEVANLADLYAQIDLVLDPSAGSLWETDPWARSLPKKKTRAPGR